MRPSMSIARSVHRVARRSYSSASFPERKVAVLGAGDGIGQSLVLLMKLNPFVSHLSLYNIVGTPGFAVDVSHINTRYEVKGYTGEEQLAQALEGADVVIILAEVPQKPSMTRDDLFNINAGIIKGLTTAIAKYCPNALINMISNPVNFMVLIVAEVLKKTGKHHSGAHSDEHHHHLWTVLPPFLTSWQAPSGKGKPCLGRTRWMIHQT